jgi:hypothetical protein
MRKKSGPGKKAEERARLSTEGEGSEPASQVVLVYTGPVADPDPGSDAFLTPGSGMGKKSGPGKEAEERARLSTETEGSEPTSQPVTGSTCVHRPGTSGADPGSGMGKKNQDPDPG